MWHYTSWCYMRHRPWIKLDWSIPDTNAAKLCIWSQSLCSSDWGIKPNLRETWTFTDISAIPKMTKAIFEKLIWRVLWLFSSVHVPKTNVEEVGLVTYTAANHQGVNQIFGFSSGGLSCRPSLCIRSIRGCEFRNLCTSVIENMKHEELTIDGDGVFSV